MKVGSLFSGIGGLDLGLERAGMTVAWQVENDDYCNKVLAKHWPNVKRYGDVRECRAHNLERVDLVCGGFPCQPVSTAGKRKGDSDDRWLWPEFARIVCELKPRWVVAENVPGLLSIDAGRLFGTVLRDLDELGYDAEWELLPACAFGAPHIRYRLFIIARTRCDTNGSRLQRDENETMRTISRPSSLCSKMADPTGERTTADQQSGRLHGIEQGGQEVGNADIFNAQAWLHESTRTWFAECRERWWAVEPDVGRVANGFTDELDGGLDAHEICIAQACSAGIPQTYRLRKLRGYVASSKASSEPRRCAYCGHPLSSLPCKGACSPWYVGARREEDEDMRCLREGVLGLLAQQGEDLLPYLSFGTWEAERPQAVGQRVDRLRGLGNAVVPQVAEWIGRRIMQCATS